MFGIGIAIVVALFGLFFGVGILGAASAAFGFLFYWYLLWAVLLAVPALLVYLGVVSAGTILGLLGGQFTATGPLGGIFGFLLGNVMTAAMLGSIILKRGLLLLGAWMAYSALTAIPDPSVERLLVGLLLWVVGLLFPSA